MTTLHNFIILQKKIIFIGCFIIVNALGQIYW